MSALAMGAFLLSAGTVQTSVVVLDDDVVTIVGRVNNEESSLKLEVVALDAAEFTIAIKFHNRGSAPVMLVPVAEKAVHASPSPFLAADRRTVAGTSLSVPYTPEPMRACALTRWSAEAKVVAAGETAEIARLTRPLRPLASPSEVELIRWVYSVGLSEPKCSEWRGAWSKATKLTLASPYLLIYRTRDE